MQTESSRFDLCNWDKTALNEILQTRHITYLRHLCNWDKNALNEILQTRHITYLRHLCNWDKTALNEILQTRHITYLRHLRPINSIITICCTCGKSIWEPLLHSKF